MVIMGQIHIFWKAEVHKNRVNLWLLFQIIVMTDYIW